MLRIANTNDFLCQKIIRQSSAQTKINPDLQAYCESIKDCLIYSCNFNSVCNIPSNDDAYKPLITLTSKSQSESLRTSKDNTN